MPFIAHNIVRLKRNTSYTLRIGKQLRLGAQVKNDYNGNHNLGLYCKWNIGITSPRSISIKFVVTRESYLAKKFDTTKKRIIIASHKLNSEAPGPGEESLNSPTYSETYRFQRKALHSPGHHAPNTAGIQTLQYLRQNVE